MKAQLSNFLTDLFTTGKVTVAPQLSPIEETDYLDSLYQLTQFYEKDILEMPATAPVFSRTGAMWAAIYLYRAIQFTMLRNLDETIIKQYLVDFQETESPETIYSMDLTFRHLPQLFHLTKGLAPADILVQILIETAAKHPFSSIGIEHKIPINQTIILKHPSLKIAYLDRIIAIKNKKLVEQYALQEEVKEVLGTQDSLLWDNF